LKQEIKTMRTSAIVADFEIANLKAENHSLRKSQLSTSHVSMADDIIEPNAIDKHSNNKLADHLIPSSILKSNHAPVQTITHQMISIPITEKKKEVKFDLGAGPTISKGAKEKLRMLHITY
jgi:hypothetical protein